MVSIDVVNLKNARSVVTSLVEAALRTGVVGFLEESLSSFASTELLPWNLGPIDVAILIPSHILKLEPRARIELAT